jgi:hypothetical protein
MTTDNNLPAQELNKIIAHYIDKGGKRRQKTFYADVDKAFTTPSIDGLKAFKGFTIYAR